MGWLLALAGTLTAAVVGYTVAVTVAVTIDRRRRQRRAATLAPGEDGAESSEDDAAADFVQLWMDNEWDQRFG